MRSRWLMHHGPHFERWSKHTIRVAQDNVTRYDLFSNQDNVTRCEHSLFAYSNAAPEMSVALFVGALHVDNRYVGLHRRHKQQWCAIQWGLLLAKRRVLAWDITAQQRA